MAYYHFETLKKLAQDRILGPKPDVICLTEARADVLPEYCCTIDSEPDYGYPIKGDCGK